MQNAIVFARNIKLNYLFEFLKYSNVMHAFWMVYLLIRGYTLVEVGLLESLFHIVSFFGETPTGILADRFGRNHTRQLGIIFHMIYLVILWQGTSFWMMALGFAFAALSFNLESGSATAFVYDTLKQINKESKFPLIEARRETLVRLASVFGSIGGGFLIALGYPWAFWVNLVSYFFILLISLWMKETTVQHDLKDGRSLKDHLKRVKVGLKNEPILFLWMGYFGLFSTTISIIGYYVTTYWQLLGWSESIMGMVLALAGLSAALGAWFAPKLHLKISLIQGLHLASFITIIGLTLMAFPLLTSSIIILLSALEGWLYVYLHALMNEKIESSVRASMLSLNAMAYSFFMMIGFPLFGFLVEKTSYPIAFIVLGGLFLFVLLIVGGISYQQRSRVITSYTNDN